MVAALVCGPYQHTYPPLLHWITALAARFTQVSPAHSYHFVTAFFYCAGPVTLFWMAYRLSGLVWPSFAGGLAYSLFSPSNFLSSVVRQDAGGWLHPRRLQALVVYGEGPHVTSMALLPVGERCVALTRRRPMFHILAAIALAPVVLTNWLGGFALATAAIAYILSKKRSELKNVAFACLTLALFAYALAARWIPPSTLAAIRANSQHIGGDYTITVAQWMYGAVLSIALLLLWVWFEQRRLPAHLRFFIVFSFLMSAVTLASAWLQIHIVPQGERYHLEMEMALCPLAAFAIAIPLGRLSRLPRLAVIVALALLCYLPGKTYRRVGREMTQPIDVRSTSEYKTSMWIGQNLQDRRVFVPGSDYLWLNAFTDTPQLEGGFDQGVTNPRVQHVHYQMYMGEAPPNGGELSILWLKAFGVHAVAV